MISEKLRQAREYEAEHGPLVPPEERPRFHVTGGVGWINDPNGFSFYRGEAHLFYQYHPYATVWGPMHWGHVKTRDFIRWERLPVALAPDMPYDGFGCFSGSALELPDGRHLLMYTGVRGERLPDGKAKHYQTQCLAVGDGVNYEKLAENPVLTARDLPEGASEVDFRDPKIWQEPDGYYAVVGNRPADGSGSALLFRSDDAFHWRYTGAVAMNGHRYGKMWECPDFFRLDGEDVLMVSAQDMRSEGLEFRGGNETLCLIGHADAMKRLTPERAQAVDYGIDFYAPQTLLAPDGRRIMIAWMQNWGIARARNAADHICGQMTLPRELRVRDGRLIQNPVRELENYRGKKIVHSDVPVRGETRLEGVRGRCLDLTVSVRPDGGAPYSAFRLNLAQDGAQRTSVCFMPGRGSVRVERSDCGFRYEIAHEREFPVASGDGRVRLRAVMDHHSLELFVNDGEQAASFVLHAPLSADAVSFGAEGEARMDVEMYELDIDGGAGA